MHVQAAMLGRGREDDEQRYERQAQQQWQGPGEGRTQTRAEHKPVQQDREHGYGDGILLGLHGKQDRHNGARAQEPESRA
jgi:hypothetical protein